MKKAIFVGFSIVFFTASAWSQRGKMSLSPDNAKIIVAFDSKFSQATKVGWDRDEDEIWYAHFQWEKKDYLVSYTEKGQWLETEYRIKKGDVPEDILAILLKDFDGYKIDDVEISETPTGLFYGFSLVKGKEVIDVMINPTGEAVRKEKSNGKRG
jgi:hypothetical protein